MGNVTDVQELVKDLKTGIVDVLYEQLDGTRVQKKVTLQGPGKFFTKALTNEEAIARTQHLQSRSSKPTGVLHVWAVEENQWVSIRTNYILSAQQTNW